MSELVPWVSLVLLGAYHGINPGMGWLFAVALGLQEKRRWAVLRAFGPIAAGHAASVCAVVAVLGAAQLVLSVGLLKWICGGILIGYGLYKLLRPFSHPKWVGMRVGPKDLALWSFLMSSAHGAGLMLLPPLLGIQAGTTAHASHEVAGIVLPPIDGTTSLALTSLLAVGVHTVTMFAVMAIVALVVYEKLGLKILRTAWINLDRIWAGTLILTGAVTFLL